VIWESTGSYLASLGGERVHGGGDVTRVVRVDREKGGGRTPPHSASCAQYTIMTECIQESILFYSMYVLSNLWYGTTSQFYVLSNLLYGSTSLFYVLYSLICGTDLHLNSMYSLI
jgi:hypothetical protein